MVKVMETIYLVMPAYNEEASIENVVKQWYPLLEGKSPESRLVIADSGSTDNTHRILLNLKEKYTQLEILDNTLKQHGPKLIAMYKYAIEKGADYIFQTDSDGQTNPKEFDAFWEMRDKYDAILGNRTVRGDGKARAFVEHVVCFLLRLYYGVKIPDANAPFRLMNAKTVAKYIDRFEKDYNLPNIMLSTFFVYYRERVTFKEITFQPRQAGVNSINVKIIVLIGIKALKDFRTFKVGMR